MALRWAIPTGGLGRAPDKKGLEGFAWLGTRCAGGSLWRACFTPSGLGMYVDSAYKV